MAGQKLDWDKAKWDSIKHSLVPTGEDIDPYEEAKLQEWWESKKQASLRSRPKDTSCLAKKRKKGATKLPKGTSVLLTEARGMALAKERRRDGVISQIEQWKRALSRKRGTKQNKKAKP
jgi:hypothetical protein